jgi:hypothetical protein
MAWFSNWFSKKSAAAGGFAPDSELLDQAHAAKSVAAAVHTPAGRKSQRMEQRELLYAVVRDTMARLGLITSSYKYKVLSLDPHGRQYMIMMDIKQDIQSQAPLMSKIERLLTQEAQLRHSIQITAVYWRYGDHKALVDHELPTPDTRVKPAAIVTATPAPVTAVKPTVVEPLDARKALEKVLSKPREHREAAPSAFPDTLLVDHEEREFPLSATQLGTLN